MDNFPTTLAAMGVKIEGDRLGLGTNLFSSQDTLYETYGKEMDAELSRRSLFMEQASEFDPNTQAYKNAVIRYKARYGDDSSVDESVTDDSSAQSADDSTTGEKNPADTATSEVGEKTDTPYNSPFPDDMADLKEHLRGKGIAGSELIKDIMKDPWKTVSANLVSVESEEAVGSEEELIADDSIQSEENLAGVANVISAKNVDDSLASEASDDSESQTAEPAGKKDSSEAEQTQDMSTAVNTASEVDSQVTSEESGSDMEEEETEEALEGSWIRSEKVSDNPLEIGPAARQMYPTMFRDPDYGFLPESKLRIDPYAAFSGNRQPKTEARITTESVKQLKDWISEWNSQATRN